MNNDYFSWNPPQLTNGSGAWNGRIEKSSEVKWNASRGRYEMFFATPHHGIGSQIQRRAAIDGIDGGVNWGVLETVLDTDSVRDYAHNAGVMNDGQGWLSSNFIVAYGAPPDGATCGPCLNPLSQHIWGHDLSFVP